MPVFMTKAKYFFSVLKSEPYVKTVQSVQSVQNVLQVFIYQLVTDGRKLDDVSNFGRVFVLTNRVQKNRGVIQSRPIK